tara:strand:+ start:35 stop:925 length:891 start_codon:yes stop_codon:yes gene_type:complete
MSNHNGMPPEILSFIASEAGSAALESPQDDEDGRTAVAMMDKVNVESSVDLINLSASLCGELKDATVLEIGPGQGAATAELLRHELKSLTVFEVSPLFRIILCENPDFSEALQNNILTIVGEDAIVALPHIPDSSVDLIVGMNVVYFLHPLNIHLHEMLRVLKPNGRLVFGTKQPGAKLGSKKHFVNTDNDAIVSAMLSAGFVNAVVGDTRLLTDPQTPPMYVPVMGKKPFLEEELEFVQQQQQQTHNFLVMAALVAAANCVAPEGVAIPSTNVNSGEEQALESEGEMEMEEDGTQ